MIYSYFPGCTLHQQARDFDQTARESARRLGISLEELKSWQCCGAVFPLATDALINLASPFRALASSHEAGADMVTLCSGCLNVLRRTNRLIAADRETRMKLEDFVEKEYSGQRRVYHLLEVMERDLTEEDIRSAAVRSLEGLRVAPYYGCLLLRPPDEMEFDDPENPQIMETLFRALGAEPVDYPFRTECCGAYLSVGVQDRTTRASAAVVRSAAKAGADLIVTSCPTCLYNLELANRALQESDPGFESLPTVYFSQVLALALGVDDETCGLGDGAWRQKLCASEVN
ncbi:MAG: CoB--CoM heterodisulfide reductase iron-sulfur subunit B family protein [Bacillota bacterium]